MTDSIKLLNENYVDRIHSSQISGKLYKGHNITAANASIPSKYQTVVTSNSDNKGFLSKCRRFNYDLQENDHPGPGSYVHHGQADKMSPSYSKKGTNCFVSKDKRIGKQQWISGPGPLEYSLPSKLMAKYDFNRAKTTSVFHKPIAQKVEKDKYASPAPNSYKVSDMNTIRKVNNVTASAAFKSKTTRGKLVDKNELSKPAPCEYDINEDQVKRSVPVPFSSFKSKTERSIHKRPNEIPGPGTYHPHEGIDPVPRLILPKKHYLCISAPAMPLPKTPPHPGPGAYDVLNHDREIKHYMSGAVFVSTTSRWIGSDAKNPDFPGPAHYRPVHCGLQSYNYNSAGRWI